MPAPCCSPSLARRSTSPSPPTGPVARSCGRTATARTRCSSRCCADADLGAASVTFHLEAAAEPVALARRLRDAGARAGVAVKPATPVEGLFDLLDDFDQILVMTVEPGFGGQSFMSEMMPKLRRLA